MRKQEIIVAERLNLIKVMYTRQYESYLWNKEQKRKEDSNEPWCHCVVDIISASHAEGPRFKPG